MFPDYHFDLIDGHQLGVNDLYTSGVSAQFHTCSGGQVSKPLFYVSWNGDYGPESEY